METENRKKMDYKVASEALKSHYGICFPSREPLRRRMHRPKRRKRLWKVTISTMDYT